MAFNICSESRVIFPEDLKRNCILIIGHICYGSFFFSCTPVSASPITPSFRIAVLGPFSHFFMPGQHSSVSIVDLLGWIILCSQGALCSVGYPPASPASAHLMPVTLLVRTIKLSLGFTKGPWGARITQWGSTVLDCGHSLQCLPLTPIWLAVIKPFSPIPIQPSVAPHCLPQKSTFSAWGSKFLSTSLQLAVTFPRTISLLQQHTGGGCLRQIGKGSRYPFCFWYGRLAGNDIIRSSGI